MKKLIFLFLFSVLLAACSQKKSEIPDNVLNQKEMVSILSDIHLAQSALSIKVKSDTINITLNDYIKSILIQHKTNKEDFLFSLKFYSDHPEILQQVYDSVITGLSKMQGEAGK